MSTSSTQKIGVATAVIIGMNAMIGAGIFSIASLLSSKVGPAGILTYLFAFAAVWFMAKSIARVAYLYPQEGSFYNYAKQWGGHKLGLFSAGAYLFGLLIAMGLLCKVAGNYLHEMIPSLSAYILGIIMLGCLVAANIMGLVLSQIGQYILIVCTVFPLITTTIMCLSQADLSNLTPFMPYGPLSVIEGTKVAIFGLFGFECTASLFNIMENPEKNVSKALTYSLLLVGIIYFLFISSIVLSIPLSVFTLNPHITIPGALRTIFPNNDFILLCVSISILSAIVGTVHSMIWSSSELMLSYFRFMDIKVIKQAISRKTLNQQVTVLIAGTAILLSYLFIENMNVFFSMTDVALIFACITSIIPLLKLKKEWQSGQNITTMLGLVTALVIFAVAVETLVGNVITMIS
tara:strand:- start:1573 stop:2787 length:1215 start_codon:yes stop_codon:yes gene_type:complete